MSEQHAVEIKISSTSLPVLMG